MKTLPLLLLLVCCSITADAQLPPARRAYADGSVLLKNCSYFLEEPKDSDNIAFARGIWCKGYVEGFHHALGLMQMAMNPTWDEFRANQNGPLGVCIPLEVEPEQLVGVIVKYLSEHPEKLHETPDALTLQALRSAFPCQAPASKPDKE